MKRRRRDQLASPALGPARAWLLAVVLSVAFLGARGTGAPAEAADPPGNPKPAAPAEIPEAEVATRAAEVPALLRRISEPLAPSSEIRTIEQRLPELRRLTDADLSAASIILRGQPTLDVLQSQLLLWQRRQLVTSAWLDLLTQRATMLQEALNQLAQIRAVWRRTRDAALASRAPGPLLLQVDGALAAIDAAEAPLQAQRTAVLDLQSGVAQEVARSGSALAQFTQAQQAAMGGMLTRDAAPLWSAAAWDEARAESRGRLVAALAGRWADVVEYVRGPGRALLWHLAGFGLLALVMCGVRHRARQWLAAHEGESRAMAVLEYPYSATAALALLVVASPLSTVSGTIRRAIEVLLLGAAIRLTRGVADPHLAPEFYMLWSLFAVDGVREAVAGLPVIEQLLLEMEIVAAIALIAYARHRGGLRLAPVERHGEGRLTSFRAAARLLTVVFVVAGVAGALGYMRLARLLAAGTLGSGALALTLFAGIRVVSGLVSFGLRAWPLRQLQMVERHRELIEHRVRNALIWAAAIGWIVRTLDFVGLYQPAASLAQAALAARLGRGAIQIAAGDVLEFVVTIWIAYLVSSFVRFVLSEDIYPRTRLTRGISYAISSLLNYVIIALGFVLALGALGLDLNKVTVLAGAFGVGIGFGLQSVVNNFVSGLILLFERPIHVGDIVEVGNLSGEVSRIGIRASTVRTWQGAEIIVPNAQLVTERVTNWTLSDRTRRIELLVGVDYGSAPEKVVAVLESVARAHPEIMQTPRPPQAVFKSFGDSSINFELRAWTNRFERWPAIQTELAGGVYAALHAAGMSLPFPQREVRVLRDHPVASGAITEVAAPPADGQPRAAAPSSPVDREAAPR